MHPVPRSLARIAALAALTVSGGLLVAVPAAMADIGADLRFVCSGESGTHQVKVRIEARGPASGAVGGPVQLGTVRIDVGLPARLVDDVLAAAPGQTPATPVTSAAPSAAPAPDLAGVAQLRIGLHDADGERHGGWPAFALAAAPSRTDGVVHMTGSGVAPPVVPRSPGEFSWTAGEMRLALVPGDGATAADEAASAFQCAADKETVLGTVPVRKASRTPAPSAQQPAPGPAAAPPDTACEEIPAPGLDPRYALNDDPALQQIFDVPPVPDGMTKVTNAGLPYCIRAVGFVNIKKAGNAVPIAAETLLRRAVTTYRTFLGPNYSEQRGYVVNRTDPVPGTVLGFGFMPTRAVAETLQVGAPGAGENDPITGNLRLLALRNPQEPTDVLEDSQIKVRSYVRIKASTANVNGVPLNLGDTCMTGSTLLSANAFLGVQQTGVLNPDVGQSVIAKDLEIPAFSGCGVTEDLSPLLTASISGAGNYVNIETGPWCNGATGSGCENNAAPSPETWTIKPGGDVTAIAKPFTLKNLFGNAQFSCEAATLRFRLDGRHWNPRFRLAKARMSFDDCEVKGSDGAVHPATATQDGDLWLNGVSIGADGKAKLTVNGVAVNAATEINGTRCALRFTGQLTEGFFPVITTEGPGSVGGFYDNTTHTFSSTPGPNLIVSPDSTCTVPGFPLPGTFGGQRLGAGTADFVFQQRQQITQP